MDGTAIRSAVESLSYGKRLPTAVYVWDEDGQHLPKILNNLCSELRKRAAITTGFNLIKFHTDRPKVSFLSYPTFFENPHPPLDAAVVVDLVTGKVRRDSYASRVNPPILHRKETFLHSTHPKRTLFARLTKEEEAAGLLKDTARIGFKLNWQQRLAKVGRKLRGHRLIQTEPEMISCDGTPQSGASDSPKMRVERHRTAIVRHEASKPVKILLEENQLGVGDSFFDYGCGLGADVRALRAAGYNATGWDPVHAPLGEKQPAEAVNLGFVLNVIEDPAERVDVLVSAWSLSKRLLVVSTLMHGQENYADFRCHGDGILTSRQTFQKHFEPAEIQALIEDTLTVEATPVYLGVYFVFRSVADQQDFLSARTQRSIDWGQLSSRLGLRRALFQRADPYEIHRELLDSFWRSAVALGRIPRDEEFGRLDEVRQACGSVPKAMGLFLERFGQATFDAARAKRREDALVYVAAARLRKRVPFTKLSLRLQRDIQSFFGSYPEAERHALDLMFAAGDVDELTLAIQKLGFGWWDAQEQQFTIHRSLLDELPVILRVYVECGARLFGNPREADLIKFHLRSRKLTFQIYDDFDGAPFPELKLRIKIDLPRMFVTVLEQRHVDDRQLLYFKERFVRRDYPGADEMVRLSRRLRDLGFDPDTLGYGPNRQDFSTLLTERGLTWRLTRKPGLQSKKASTP